MLIKVKGKLFNVWKSLVSLFNVRRRESVKTVDMNENLFDIMSKIRYIKDNVLDLIRIEETECTTKYHVLEYQQEIDEIRISALDSLAVGRYDSRTQFLLINKILSESSELIDLISDLVLRNATDIEIKRTCLVHAGQVI